MTGFKVGDRVRFTHTDYLDPHLGVGEAGTIQSGGTVLSGSEYVVWHVMPDKDVDGTTWPYEPYELELLDPQ